MSALWRDGVAIVALGYLIISHQAKEWRLGPASALGIAIHIVILTTLPDFSRPPNVRVPFWSLGVGDAYCLTALVSYMELGRNISIIPSLKNIVSGGLYRLVRHPIYSSLIHMSLYTAIIWPNPVNLLRALGMFIGAALRVGDEEAVLSRDPAYAEYRRNITVRFFHPALSLPLVAVFLHKMMASWALNRI